MNFESFFVILKNKGDKITLILKHDPQTNIQF